MSGPSALFVCVMSIGPLSIVPLFIGAVWGSQLPWSVLATFCRSLSTMLHSGVNIVKAFQVAGGQSRHPALREMSRDIVDEIRKGTDITQALRQHKHRIPELMIDLVNVAERTGSLPEVLAALADHYDNLVRLRKTFLGQIAFPIFQLVAAIGIVALLIFFLGIIADSNKGPANDILGLGLVGTRGALVWLGLCFGSAFAGWVIFQLVTRGLAGRSFVHSLLLSIPVVGSCLRSFAMARFSWAFALTQQAGMSIEPSLEASLKATGNGAFAGAIPQVTAMVMGGEELSDALAATGLFPVDYLELIRVGEATGTVPETLQRLSPQLEDQARRSLSAMTAVLAWLIWSLVAMLIAFIVFRIFSGYIAQINDAANGI